MEKSEYRRNAYAMIYLAACAVKGKKPDAEKIGKFDLHQLFEVCQHHIMTACADYALEAAGIQDNEFTQAKEKAIRKNILLDMERGKILRRLEEEHIWYMPLKGSILKDWYPKLGMRQMSDNDILCDDSARARIKEIMIDLGFTCNHYGIGNDDAYHKEPVSNFEMHNELFTVTHGGNLHQYYADVKSRLLKDENNSYGYHFRIEDFYIYMTAHEYRHFSKGGTGVRSLLDTYVFMHKFGDSLDWNYMNEELEKLGIRDYERQSRELALKVFRLQKLTVEEKKMLDYYIFSGVYGTLENRVENQLNEEQGGSKLHYLYHRLIPSMDMIQMNYPFFYKHKVLIPMLLIYRPIRGFSVNGKRFWQEFKLMMKKK